MILWITCYFLVFFKCLYKVLNWKFKFLIPLLTLSSSDRIHTYSDSSLTKLLLLISICGKKKKLWYINVFCMAFLNWINLFLFSSFYSLIYFAWRHSFFLCMFVSQWGKSLFSKLACERINRWLNENCIKFSHKTYGFLWLPIWQTFKLFSIYNCGCINPNKSLYIGIFHSVFHLTFLLTPAFKYFHPSILSSGFPVYLGTKINREAKG